MGLLEGQATAAVSWAGRPIGGARKASGVSPGCPFGIVTSEDLVYVNQLGTRLGAISSSLQLADWSKLGQLGVRACVFLPLTL